MMKVDVYDTFIKGAKNGFFTVIKIMPTLKLLLLELPRLSTPGRNKPSCSLQATLKSHCPHPYMLSPHYLTGKTSKNVVYS